MTQGWLLDTNVVSELAKGARADREVTEWVAQADESELFLSVITLSEIVKGIGLAEARGRDMRRQRDFLSRELPMRFAQRILPFDASGNASSKRPRAAGHVSLFSPTFPVFTCAWRER